MSNEARARKGKSWRDVLPVHPAADLFPLMSPDELKVLGEDIKKNGLEVPIVLCPIDKRPFFALLDGRNRLDAMEAAGLPVGITTVNRDLTMDATFQHTLVSSKWDPYAYVLSANIHRRHLTTEQKRELIAKVLKAQPEKSDRAIAKVAKVDHKTVGSVRDDLVGRGEIPHVEAHTDTKGRKQPAKKKHRERPADADYPTLEACLDGSADNYEWGDDDPGVAPPEEILSNLIETIERHEAVARAYKKVLAVSKFEQASKDEVSAAISTLMNTWQSVQRALARQAPIAAPIQEAEPEITPAVTDTATPARATPVEMPDLPEFLRRSP
jgi:hypothetical protein